MHFNNILFLRLQLYVIQFLEGSFRLL